MTQPTQPRCDGLIDASFQCTVSHRGSLCISDRKTWGVFRSKPVSQMYSLNHQSRLKSITPTPTEPLDPWPKLPQVTTPMIHSQEQSSLITIFANSPESNFPGDGWVLSNFEHRRQDAKGGPWHLEGFCIEEQLADLIHHNILWIFSALALGRWWLISYPGGFQNG